jgi:hypothetical protein
MHHLEPITIEFVSKNGFILNRICECPLCHTMTMFYRLHQGATYCYRCVPEEGNDE